MSRHNKHKGTQPTQEKVDRLTKYKQMLDELRQKEQLLRMQGNTLQADYLFNSQIRPLWKQIEREQRPKPQPLLTLCKEVGYNPDQLVYKIIKVHMVADYMTDLVAQIKDEIKKIGAEDCNFFKITDAVFNQCQFLASMMAGDNYGALTRMLLDDDDYLEAMDKTTEDYLHDHGAHPDQWIRAQNGEPQPIEDKENKDGTTEQQND